MKKIYTNWKQMYWATCTLLNFTHVCDYFAPYCQYVLNKFRKYCLAYRLLKLDKHLQKNV